MENSYICKFWKLDMLEESAQIVYKEKKRIIVDIPSPETRDSIPDWLVKVMRKENGYDPKLIIKRNLFLNYCSSGSTIENSYICKFWKLDMLEESAQIIYKEKKKIIVDIPSPETRDSIPDWLVKVMRKENGYDPKLIIKRKKLFQTDLNTTQSCLSMHLSQLKNTDFLTKDETITIDEHFLKTKKEGLKVVLVDPKSHKHDVDLKKWKGNGDGVWKYVFNNGWNKVIATKIFEVNHVIEIWSFRDGSGKLCFALSSPTKSDER